LPAERRACRRERKGDDLRAERQAGARKSSVN
jgi:hypothetical protein